MANNRKIDRVGQTNTNNQGLEMRITVYENNKHVIVKFTQTGEFKQTTYYDFRRGKVQADLINYPVKQVNIKYVPHKHLLWGLTATCIALLLTLLAQCN
jgi:hypothetical protein